tara:strand:- start:224 stop:583 length:360 start_codon:yes stop_codon:yes gene_type:complete
MNAEEIIKLKKNALYTSLESKDFFSRFFNKSMLHYAVIMEVFSKNNFDGISYEQLCSNVPKVLGSRSSIQNLLNEGLDKKIFKKIENNKDKRIKNYFLSDEFSNLLIEWIKKQKNIFNH